VALDFDRLGVESLVPSILSSVVHHDYPSYNQLQGALVCERRRYDLCVRFLCRC